MSSNELFHSSSNSKLQKLIFCLSGIGWGIGMGVQVWVGLLLSEIKSEWGLSYTTEVIVPISLMSGMFIGSYFWGIISDKYGRMISYKQTMIFIAIGLILGTFALDVWMLSISFAITGFGIGGCFTVDGTVFIEHASAEKGHLLITLNIFGPIFSAVPPLLSYIYSNSTFGTWRSVQGTLGLISLILALPRFWIKETPMYLNLKMQSQLQPVNINSESFISESNQITLTEMLIILFKRPLKTFTILYIIIFAGINFSFSGINSFLPEILKRAHLEASKTQIYELIFFDQISKIYTVGLPAVVLSTYLVKGSMGRKLTYSLSLLFAAVFVFAFIIPDQFSLYVASLMYFFFQNLAYSIMAPIAIETYPVIVRNTALGIFGCSATLFLIFGSICASILLETTEENFVFVCVFAGSLLISAISAIFVVETKGFDADSHYYSKKSNSF